MSFGFWGLGSKFKGEGTRCQGRRAEAQLGGIAVVAIAEVGGKLSSSQWQP